MDEHVHSFYPSLAERIGLNEAIVIQQIHSWIVTYAKNPKEYTERHWHDGRWWIWNSAPDWHEVLPYLSESTIKRTLHNLRELKIVKTANYNALPIDRTLWYTIDYAAYDKLWSDQEAKMTLPSCHFDTMQEANLARPLPSSSSDFSASKGGATAPAPADGFVDINDDPFWDEHDAQKEPPPNPAEERLARMRSKFGADIVTVAHTCQQAQAREGTWTVPVHRGLSPACAVYKEATGYSPATAVREDIDAAIPPNEEALHNWYKVAHGWVLTGYSYRNVAGMLDWYAEGRVGRDAPQGGQGNGGASTPRNGTGGIDPEKLRIYKERMGSRLVGGQ